MMFESYVAVGDSFTEGVGDETPDGGVRGWADLVALGLALASSVPVSYANLAIRGRLLSPIANEQMDAAIALRPQLISINGGGNDIMRPRVSINRIADQLLESVDRAVAAGSHVLLASGANPTRHIPLGARIEVRGDHLAAAVRGHLPRENVTWVDNWGDSELTDLRYWSRDQLHLGPLGHRRVASNVLAALEVPVPDFGPAPADPARPRTSAYWREYVLPWIGRRLTGRSSGDNREPKIAELTVVSVPG
ncbi:lysophospholipase L1-like esterase [Leifsonia sp. AK011]|uniref:SGNH/GDSL hydrolase family protein n=1 Tax=Leifsonia sp. AK011 TaxID=2723075 RepID=UPI0015C94121|nr:SGNH/GDSL hydrolase family protein [Leifsonia sp. AK011]NYF09953.1 lysophospholipase L1-like esterase [Leifsonia sp. AK011]